MPPTLSHESCYPIHSHSRRKIVIAHVETRLHYSYEPASSTVNIRSGAGEVGPSLVQGTGPAKYRGCLLQSEAPDGFDVELDLHVYTTSRPNSYEERQIKTMNKPRPALSKSILGADKQSDAPWQIWRNALIGLLLAAVGALKFGVASCYVLGCNTGEEAYSNLVLYSVMIPCPLTRF